MSDIQNREFLPTVALRGFVAFPGMVLHFDVGREKSKNALNKAMEQDRKIYLVSQKYIGTEDPGFNDLNRFGVVADIKQIVKLQDGALKVMVVGAYRAKLESLEDDGVALVSQITPKPFRPIADQAKCRALMRTIREQFAIYSNMMPKIPNDMKIAIENTKDPIVFSQYIASNIILDFDNKQRLLNETSTLKRLRMLMDIFDHEIDVLSVEHEIMDKVKMGLEQNQREHLLREQMKVINAELGEDGDFYDELNFYREKILTLGADEESTEKLFKEVDKLSKLPYGAQEGSVIRNYLDTCIELPFNVYTKDNLNIEKAEKTLNKDHFGLEKVKDKILDAIAVKNFAPKGSGQILCLVGPPGVGKTSIAKSLAKAMNRNYVRIALGGVKDESEIRGHRKTYVGSMPGRIIDAMKKAGSKNPLILLDEIDKMSNDFRGDPSSALLEVLDGEQNKYFRDHYLELPFDLSDVVFITTANDAGSIPAPLYDRMDIVELSSYTREEKFKIARNFLVRKNITKCGLTSKQVAIADSALFSIIDDYTREAGVRTLERQIITIIKKAAKSLLVNDGEKVRVTDKNLSEFLGNKKFSREKIFDDENVGIVNGLAWTSVGGEMLPIEVSILDGSGKIELTGNLGDVMKESARIAISYVRFIADKYNIDKDFYKTKDIHIHAPEGAVPKDGPSAGITLVTALVSALTDIPVSSKIAMTGEISLRGKVMAIGGLKEKVMAAHREGVETVFIPYSNIPSIEDVDSKILEQIKFAPVRNLDEILSILFETNVNIDTESYELVKRERIASIVIN